MGFFFDAVQRAMGVPPESKQGIANETAAEWTPFRAEEPFKAPTPAAPRKVAPVSAPAHAQAASAPAPAHAAPAAAGAVAVRTAEYAAEVRRLPNRSLFNLVMWPNQQRTDAQSMAVEQYRVLRARVVSAMQASKCRVLMVTSAVAGEGKTLNATNLAFALSQLDRTRVLLVDFDLRKPSLAHVFGVECHGGVAAVLRREENYRQGLWKGTDSFFVLPTAEAGEQATELMHSSRVPEVLAEMSADFDYVILDTPPCVPVADSQVLSEYVDGALMIVRADETPSELVAETSAALQSKLIGSVLNATKVVRRKGYSYKYAAYRAGSK